MPAISVFDMFKVGVGPSSSHTLGPWRAAERFLKVCEPHGRPERVAIDLYGSLAKTGTGHGTDLAVLMGLSGLDPETCDVNLLGARFDEARAKKHIPWAGGDPVTFELVFHRDEALPFHPNGLTFAAFHGGQESARETYYSIGGGFVVQEGEQPAGPAAVQLPHPIDHAEQLLGYCVEHGLTIPGVVWRNELAWRDEASVRAGLQRIWGAMRDCIRRGCATGGTLPGGLNVVRRAAKMYSRLIGDRHSEAEDSAEWLRAIRGCPTKGFEDVLAWVSCFALAVNEENAAFGRVVTAPTNGAAGVIPAVLAYYVAFKDGDDRGVEEFMLTAGEVGSLFKKGATISAAMGGCQAEIGVSSAMAAAGLCQVLGGSPGQVLMAAEIAMEHHLGMTCDPVGGLVQVPCIERNTMGAVKAITASTIALASDPTQAKVSLDDVIRCMWETALDMNSKYKETSEGGLAIQLPVNMSEC